jgi:hypothetical protein
MANLTIRVGASVDRSVAAAFKSVGDAARAAQRQTQAGERTSTAIVRAEAGKQHDAHVKATQKLEVYRERVRRSSMRMAQTAADAESRAAERAAEKAKRLEEKKTRDASREMDKRVALAIKEARDINRAMEEQDRSDRKRLKDGVKAGFKRGGGIGWSATKKAFGFTKDVAGDLVSGLGVDTSFSSSVARNTALEAAAVDLSNSAYQAGEEGPNGKRVDPRRLIEQARSVGRNYAVDPSSVLEGLGKFSADTGDLATARDIVEDLARLSKATGTSFEDMIGAAGQVSVQLGDIPGKQKKIVDLMKAFAGQGKLGAVEIRDLASQMPAIASSAGGFEGGGERNLATLGAFAQIARQRGGSKTAAQAANDIQSFSSTFGKAARRKEFDKLGISLDSQTERGKTRDPIEILVEALAKTKGDVGAMNKLFMDVGARRATGGLRQVFNESYSKAGGNEAAKLEAAMAAVRREIDRLRETAVGEGEIRDSLNAALATSASKTQIFNNKFDELTEELSGKALPALERLGPAVLALVPAVTAAVPVFLEAATDLANLIARATGGDVAVADKAAFDAAHRSQDVVVRARAAAESGTKAKPSEVDPEDLKALKAERDRAAAEAKRRKADYEVNKSDDGLPASDQEVVRKKGAENAQLDVDRLERAIRLVETAITGGRARFKVDNPSKPEAPGGALKRPVEAKTR